MKKRHALFSGVGVAALTLVLAVFTLPAAAQQQTVGKTAAVNQDAKVDGRLLEIGANVLHKERITTDARGAVQLLFIDRTTLSIGPNSDIVIDEYVYDPNKKVGQMTVSLGKGLMRFVGGQITHTGSATVKTPPATIGIRGGMVDIKLDGRNVSASNAFGVVTLRPTSGPGAGQAFNVPQGHTGLSNGVTRPAVSVTTQQQMNANTQQLMSKPGQTGGAAATTTNNASTASNRNTTTTVSITPRSAPAPGSTAPGPVPVVPAGASPTGLAGTTPTGAGTGGGTTTAGSTATGGGSIFSNPAANVFSTGLPTTVTTSTTSVQTSNASTGAQQSQPANPPPPPPPPPPPVVPPVKPPMCGDIPCPPP